SVAVARELDRQLLQAWIVPDHQYRVDSIGDLAQTTEEILGIHPVQPILNPDRDSIAHSRGNDLKRPAGARCGGAQHEAWSDPLPSDVPRDAPRRPLPARRER